MIQNTETNYQMETDLHQAAQQSNPVLQHRNDDFFTQQQISIHADPASDSARTAELHSANRKKRFSAKLKKLLKKLGLKNLKQLEAASHQMQEVLLGQAQEALLSQAQEAAPEIGTMSTRSSLRLDIDTTVSEASKLKGVLWPCKDIFDSATPETKRKRNQKKDVTLDKRNNLGLPSAGNKLARYAGQLGCFVSLPDGCI
ncbi:hypothetical protein IWZ01DRAFT_545929 [Phyllosticta capitalensis]|uniref:Uncharacterized protein n=1 Tax=Phyllosticta capitalensis TaxID=121624 RepID=A0ABR1Y9P8_9PEZI